MGRNPIGFTWLTKRVSHAKKLLAQHTNCNSLFNSHNSLLQESFLSSKNSDCSKLSQQIYSNLPTIRTRCCLDRAKFLPLQYFISNGAPSACHSHSLPLPSLCFWIEWHTRIPWHSSGKWIMHTLRMLSSLMAGCLLQREKAGTCVTGHSGLHCFII